jgi:elongation factor G
MWAGWLTSACIPEKVPPGRTVLNATKGRRERIGRMVRMYADRREDITEVSAGDIGAVWA